jgi:hypothetical protein
MARKKMKAKKAKAQKTKARKPTPAKPKKKVKAARPAPPKAAAGRRKRRVLGRAEAGELVSYEARGLGARTAGQSGDTQGLSARPTADSESVEELLEEGQSFEAEILSGVENAADPDESEVKSREVPEDDVPEEYRDEN